MKTINLLIRLLINKSNTHEEDTQGHLYKITLVAPWDVLRVLKNVVKEPYSKQSRTWNTAHHIILWNKTDATATALISILSLYCHSQWRWHAEDGGQHFLLSGTSIRCSWQASPFLVGSFPTLGGSWLGDWVWQLIQFIRKKKRRGKNAREAICFHNSASGIPQLHELHFLHGFCHLLKACQ